MLRENPLRNYFFLKGQLYTKEVRQRMKFIEIIYYVICIVNELINLIKEIILYI